jgi:hypothetical protein
MVRVRVLWCLLLRRPSAGVVHVNKHLVLGRERERDRESFADPNKSRGMLIGPIW